MFFSTLVQRSATFFAVRCWHKDTSHVKSFHLVSGGTALISLLVQSGE